MRRVHINAQNLQNIETQFFAKSGRSYAHGARAHHIVIQKSAACSYSVSQKHSCALSYCKPESTVVSFLVYAQIQNCFSLQCKAQNDMFCYTISPKSSCLLVRCEHRNRIVLDVQA